MSKEPNVMLAPNEAVEFDDPRLKFPMYASVKYDGIRLKMMPETPVNRVFGQDHAVIFSRQHTVQSNALHRYFKALLQLVQTQQIVLDGKLWSPVLKFNEIMSAIKKPLPEHQLQYHVFDMMTLDEWQNGTEQPFMDRVEEYRSWITRHCRGMATLSHSPMPKVVPVEQCLVRNAPELEAFYTTAITYNHEGCMVRGLRSRYKHGQGTLNEGLIFKFKKWVTTNAQIIGFKQATRRKLGTENEDRTRDAMGHLKPSAVKATREPIQEIGSVQVQLKDGTKCCVGGGKGDTLGKAMLTWHRRQDFIDRWVEIKFQEHGVRNKPRMGQIVRFRPDLDKLVPSIKLLDAFAPPPKGQDYKVTVME